MRSRSSIGAGCHRKWTGTLFLAGLLAILGMPSSAFAQTTRYAWPNGGGVPPCIDPFNPCPLIADAIGASAAGDTIILGSGTFLEHGLTITFELTINGAGVGTSIIDAQGQDRHVLVDAPGDLVTIKDVTLVNGTADPADAGGGGAVRVSAGSLEVVRAEISQSEAYQGGAISCYQGCEELTVRDSSLVGNQSVLSGGAIYTQAETLVAKSTLTGNSTDGLGGAIYGFASGTVTVRDSQIAANSAVDGGGGIARQFGSMKILRSSLVGNSSATVGGAVFVYSNAAEELLVLNSTFSGNSAPDGGAIYQLGSFGAWLGNLTLVDNVATVAGNADDITADGASITLSNSIVTHPSGSANPECTGALAGAMLGSNNLIDTNASCVGAGNFRRARIANGALGPLGFNGGGPTQSYPLVAVGGGNRDPINAVAGGCLNPRTGVALTQDQNLRPRAVPGDIGAVVF